MFTKTNIPERIMSIQDDSCRAITAEFSCQSVARNYLFPQENSLVSMNTRCINNDKNLIYKNLSIDTWITFTLYSNYTVAEDSEYDDDNDYVEYDNTNYDDTNNDYNTNNDDNTNIGGGKPKKSRKSRKRKSINKRNKKRKTMKKGKKGKKYNKKLK